MSDVNVSGKRQKEEQFKKHFPQYVYENECLSPYFDLFEAGWECGFEMATKGLKAVYKKQRNKRIDELQKKVAEKERLQMQIDKMKRCENCKNLRFVQIKQNKIISHCVLEKDIYSSKPKPGICNNHDKWELAEDMTVEVCCSATN